MGIRDVRGTRCYHSEGRRGKNGNGSAPKLIKRSSNDPVKLKSSKSRNLNFRFLKKFNAQIFRRQDSAAVVRQAEQKLLPEELDP